MILEKSDWAAAERCPLFCGIGPEELGRMLDCLGARKKSFAAGEAVLRAGEAAHEMGVLLSGRAQLIREEYDGSRTIVVELLPGDLFGEAYACAVEGAQKLPVTVLCVEESAVWMLGCRRVAATCPSACPFHTRLIENMIAVLAEKNRVLNRRLGHLSRRSTREKLLSYLGEQAASSAVAAFTIPFSRQELADYLCVERSAMSAALSKLQREGVLRYQKNRFILSASARAETE